MQSRCHIKYNVLPFPPPSPALLRRSLSLSLSFSPCLRLLTSPDSASSRFPRYPENTGIRPRRVSQIMRKLRTVLLLPVCPSFQELGQRTLVSFYCPLALALRFTRSLFLSPSDGRPLDRPLLSRGGSRHGPPRIVPLSSSPPENRRTCPDFTLD